MTSADSGVCSPNPEHVDADGGGGAVEDVAEDGERAGDPREAGRLGPPGADGEPRDVAEDGRGDDGGQRPREVQRVVFETEVDGGGRGTRASAAPTPASTASGRVVRRAASHVAPATANVVA